MKKKLTNQDYVVSQWSGGTTTQLAIGPEGSVYADRTFLWRISSATVDLPASDFTPLPDYHRLITPLAGEMFLSHDGGAEFEVPIGTIHSFDGGAATHSRGTCTDFNLMLRKGQAEGCMEAVTLQGCEKLLLSAGEKETSLFYLFAGDMEGLAAGQSLIIEGETAELAARKPCFGIKLSVRLAGRGRQEPCG